MLTIDYSICSVNKGNTRPYSFLPVLMVCFLTIQSVFHFSSFVFVFTVFYISNGDIDEGELNILVQQRVDEVDELNRQVVCCQQMITDLYVSKLSTAEMSQCQVQ